MTESVFDRMLRLAKERRGWSRSDLTMQLGESKQTLTNWKARGVPAGQYGRIVETIGGISIDEIVGKRPSKSVAFSSPVVLTVTQAEIDALDPEKREMVLPLIAVIRGAVKSGESSSSKPGRKS